MSSLPPVSYASGTSRYYASILPRFEGTIRRSFVRLLVAFYHEFGSTTTDREQTNCEPNDAD